MKFLLYLCALCFMLSAQKVELQHHTLTEKRLDALYRSIENILGAENKTKAELYFPKKKITHLNLRTQINQFLSEHVSMDKEKHATVLNDLYTKLCSEVTYINDAELLYQSSGILKTSIELAKYTIGPNSFMLPMRLSLHPEMRFREGVETKEGKHLKLMDESNGLATLVLSKHKTFYRQGDFFVDYLVGFAGSVIGVTDSLKMKNTLISSLNMELGVHAEVPISSDNLGILWGEISMGYRSLFGKTYTSVYGNDLKSSFLHAKISGGMELYNFIQIKAESYKAFSSAHTGLDNGFIAVSFGFIHRF